MDTNNPVSRYATASLSIVGMTCSSCSNAIQDGLRELYFVQHSNISALTNSGTVVFDQSNPNSLSHIIQAIEDRGFECSVRSIEPVQDKRGSTKSEKSSSEICTEKRTRTIQLKTEGLPCGHCPLRLAKVLSQHFEETIQVTQLKPTILDITYQPKGQSITIRSIVRYLQLLYPSLKITPYHPPSAEDESKAIAQRERYAILWRLALAGFIAIPTFFIGVVWMSLVPEDDSIRTWFEQPFWTGHTARSQWALFILATPVYLISASNFHTKASKEIYSLWRRRSRVPILRRFYRFGSMNLLISAGTTVAYLASLALLGKSATSPLTSQNSTYFDSVVFLTFFILIGRFLEALSKAKAGDAISMLSGLRPQKAILIAPKDGLLSDTDTTISHASGNAPSSNCEVAIDLLEVGDVVLIPHGSTPPADGVLLSNEAQFDESSLTGESRPVRKFTNDKMFLGTINTGNPVEMMVTDLGGGSMLDQIIAVVREGQTRRAPVERIADAITGYFVPVITLLAILTFFIWLALGQSGALDPKYLEGHTGGWAFWSLEFAIAVFVVACPCGIGLAAPTALYVGTGLAAKAGILVRGGGEAFQDASHLDAIVFDKTGTLTEGGDLQVTDCVVLQKETFPEEILWIAARLLEDTSTHPIAKAIASRASKETNRNLDTLEINEIPGKGMRGRFYAPNDNKNYEVLLGSESLIRSVSTNLLDDNTTAIQLLSSWKTECKSIAVMAVRDIDDTVNATWHITTLFALSDPIRPSAAATIATLQQQGIKTYMLSGDNPETARAVALAVGIPITNVFAGALPQDKATRIEQLKSELSVGDSREARRKARIAFVGDGINDAPALTAATVSISLSTGSPIALTSSSFILLTPSLDSIITLLGLSKKVFRRIKWNFGWALVYNAVLIPVAAGVFFKTREDGFVLGPVWASAAMALSSVSVILGSLAMRWGF